LSNGRCTGRNDRKGGWLKDLSHPGNAGFFSTVGILAEKKIGIFVISAFHTDDVPVKREAV